MLSSKCAVSNVIFAIFLLLFSIGSFAQVLELGEEQLFGKKDQPEAMTFISRAPLDDSTTKPQALNVSEKIKEPIVTDIFKISTKE